MASWTERFLVLAVVLAAGAQAGAPGELFVSDGGLRAVLLEDGDFFSSPSSDGDIVARFPAGTILDYVGETTDEFGREWFTVRHPQRIERRRDVYLTNLDGRRFADLGYRAAVLADRQPIVVAARAPRSVAGAPRQRLPPPWWEPVAVVARGHNATFDAVLAISARAPGEDDLLEAIDLLGGLEAIATWPASALPGELFVPAMLPALFQFEGAEWRLARPVRLLGDSISLLGNPRFVVDPEAPTFAGGPVLHCWSLVDSLDPMGVLAGSVQVAPPVEVVRRGRVPGGGAAAAPATTSVVPPAIRQLLAPPPPTMLVPPRVDPPAPPDGVLLEDVHSQQAVYLEQTLGLALTRRLRGKSLVLDVVTRNPPRAASAATLGVDIEVRFADERPGEHFATSFSSSAAPVRAEFPFDIPADAETITVRLLAADRSVAREQRGAVIFERATLRLATWAAEPAASSVVLYRITANAFEGAQLHTRAPIVVTARPAEEVEQVWVELAATDWSSADKQQVLAGEIRHGMSEEQVRLSWGEPFERTMSDAAGGGRRWDYADRDVVFAGGSVIAFRPRRREIRDRSGFGLMCPGVMAVSPAEIGR